MRRLSEDPQCPAEVREDLLRSQAAGWDYLSADKAARLQAALADPTRHPFASTSRRRVPGRRLVHAFRALHPGWKLALLLAAGGFGALGLRPTPLVSPQPAQRRQHTDRQRHDAQRPPRAAATGSPRSEPALQPAPVSAPSAAPAAAPTRARAQTPGLTRAAARSPRREIDQLVQIRARLATDPAAALRLAQRSEREFPGGLLSEERQALAIVALARSGAREAARAQARAFASRHPDSPMRDIIEAELGRVGR